MRVRRQKPTCTYRAVARQNAAVHSLFRFLLILLVYAPTIRTTRINVKQKRAYSPPSDVSRNDTLKNRDQRRSRSYSVNSLLLFLSFFYSLVFFLFSLSFLFFLSSPSPFLSLSLSVSFHWTHRENIVPFCKARAATSRSSKQPRRRHPTCTLPTL